MGKVFVFYLQDLSWIPAGLVIFHWLDRNIKFAIITHHFVLINNLQGLADVVGLIDAIAKHGTVLNGNSFLTMTFIGWLQ